MTPTSPEAQRAALLLFPLPIWAATPDHLETQRQQAAQIIESAIQSAHRELIGEREKLYSDNVALNEQSHQVEADLSALRSLLAEAEGALAPIVKRLEGSEARGRPALVAINYAKLDLARSILSKLRDAQKGQS